MARAARIKVRGLDRATDRLDLLGLRAFDQREALKSAAAAAPMHIKPRWRDRSGDLTDSLSMEQNQHVYAQSFTIVSDVFYSQYVFYGTSHMTRRPPLVRRKAITTDTQMRVASALVRR